MTLYDILLLVFPIAIVFVVISHNRKFVQAALRAAREHAQRNGLQFLDQSIVLDRLRWVKDERQWFSLQRVYRFEFSVRGDRRYQGWVTITRGRVARVESEAVPERDFEPG